MRNPATLFIALLDVALAAGLAWLWVDKDLTLRDFHWHPPAAVAPDPASLAALDVQRPADDPERYREILERPLFASSRRSPPPPVLVAAPAVKPLTGVRLLGLIEAENSQSAAIVNVEGKNRRLRIGNKLNGWTFDSVSGRAAVFVSDSGENHHLVLVRASGPAPASGSGEAAPSAPGAPEVQGSAAPAAPVASAVKTIEEQARERLARRNAIRIKNGLPPLKE